MNLIPNYLTPVIRVTESRVQVESQVTSVQVQVKSESPSNSERTTGCCGKILKISRAEVKLN